MFKIVGMQEYNKIFADLKYFYSFEIILLITYPKK